MIDGSDTFRAARTEHQAGRLAEAEVLYRQVLADKPDHADALHLLGVLAFQTRHTEAARELISQAIQIYPHSAEYYSNYSIVLNALGKFTESLAAIEKALQFDPTNAEYLNNLGVTHMRLRQWEPAATAFTAAISARSNYDMPRFNLGQLYALAGRSDEAILAYRDALKHFPDRPDALQSLAQLLQSVQRRDEALAILERKSDQPANPRPADTGVVTNPMRTDGFGAQFQTIIYSVIYAELNRKKFVYTPFKEMAHNYNHDPDFLAKKEKLINFLPHFEVNNGHEQSIIREDFIRFFEQNLDACSTSESLKKIRRIFRENKSIARGDGVEVAIHVRRPNPCDNRTAGTDTPDALYVNIINVLKTVQYPGKKLNIHIHSQGKADMFQAYSNIENISLHLDEPVEETFTAMVLADVLVTSRSSLSYVAGILSQGDVYYLPFWHPPMRHWKVLV